VGSGVLVAVGVEVGGTGVDVKVGGTEVAVGLAGTAVEAGVLLGVKVGGTNAPATPAKMSSTKIFRQPAMGNSQGDRLRASGSRTAVGGTVATASGVTVPGVAAAVADPLADKTTVVWAASGTAVAGRLSGRMACIAATMSRTAG
jgi:hypothetical protein